MRKWGGMADDMSPRAVGPAVAGLARDKRFAEIEELFAPRLRAAMSAETLRLAWGAELDRCGPVSAIGAPAADPARAGLIRVTVPVTCARGGLTLIMSVDGGGLLHGLRLGPPAVARPWKPPRYAAPKRFEEREVTVGSGPMAVPGTLSLPRAPGRRPGVVLLSGAGPVDRDETSGPNKPLKDLAWGLASRGVAVVRFDKVTWARGAQLASAPGFTMEQEYVPHAIAAVAILTEHPGIDPSRVVVLGHGAGGQAAPMIAAAEESVAGLVILAGAAQPMPEAAVRVARYLAALHPGPAAEALAAAIARQAAVAGNPDLPTSTPAAELPFGLPASYWRDQSYYDPVGTAAALDRPMLILQGGRDYQVTVQDDLARWRAGLGQRADVAIRVYDADDHLFFRGTGPSGPADYEAAQHVDPAVVADIAGWLAPGPDPGLRRARSLRRRG
jgi:dienelactone hydrolase